MLKREKLLAEDLKEFISKTSSFVKKSEAPRNLYLEKESIAIKTESITISLFVEAGIVACLDFEQIKKFSNVLDKKDVVSFTKDDLVVYVHVNGKQMLKMKEVKDQMIVKTFTERFPIIESWKVSRNDIQSMIDSLAFHGNDELRPAMNGVCLDSYVCATDGTMLYFKEMENEVGKTKTTEYLPHFDVDGNRTMREIDNYIEKIIPTEIVVFLKNFALNYNFYVGCKLGEKAVIGQPELKNQTIESFYGRFVNEFISIEFRMYEGRFPDYKNVIPNFNQIYSAQNIYEFDREAMKKITKMAKATNDMQMVINVNEDIHQAFITANNVDEDLEFKNNIEVLSIAHVLFEGKKPEYGTKIGVNPCLFEMVLNCQKSKSVRLKMQAPNRALMIDENYLLMPVMINEYV